MEKKYIDAWAFYEKMIAPSTNLLKFNPFGLKEEINRFPAADVAEIKHGHFIIDEDGTPRCSACGEQYLDSTAKYCPDCGARMDEPEVHESWIFDGE